MTRREWLKVAYSNNVSYPVVRYRLEKLGWTLEKAATTPPTAKKTAEEVRLKKYAQSIIRELSLDASVEEVQEIILAKRAHKKQLKEYRDIAKKNGINYMCFALRVRSGWPMERATTQPPQHRKKKGV